MSLQLSVGVITLLGVFIGWLIGIAPAWRERRRRIAYPPPPATELLSHWYRVLASPKSERRMVELGTYEDFQSASAKVHEALLRNDSVYGLIERVYCKLGSRPSPIDARREPGEYIFGVAIYYKDNHGVIHRSV